MAESPLQFSKVGLPFRALTSVALAALLAALIVWSAPSGRAHILTGFIALYCFAVAQQDVFRYKIPNLITFPAFLVGLGVTSQLHGLEGVVSGLLGAGLVFLILFLPFAARGIRAGDVKALMVLGVLWGPELALGLLFWSTLFGGLIAVVLLLWRGGIQGLSEMLGRWKLSVGVTLATQRMAYVRAPDGAAARTGLPYGVPIALGVIALQRWGLPW